MATPIAGAHNTNPPSRSNGNSPSQTASASDPASQTRSLAVSGAPARSIPLAVSDSQGRATAEQSGSGANAAGSPSNAVQGSTILGDGSATAKSNQLNPLFAAGGSMDSASALVSAGNDQPSDVATASGRRAASRSNASLDLSARSIRSAQPGQHASSAEPAAGLGSRGVVPAQGNPTPASSIIGPSASSLPAPASGSGPAPGSNLGSVSSSSSTAAGVSPGETFAALDGDAPAGSVNWTHTGAQRAEAGFEDPALGWVGVRADLGSGSVHASLVAGSAEAAQTLGSHLAGLNDYLAERHPGVGTVTVAGYENSGSSTNAQSGSGTESGTQSGSQSSPHQGSTSNADSGSSNNGNSTIGRALAGSNAISRAGEGADQTVPSNSALPVASLAAETLGRSSGSYISVMA
jgi:hypothetical protein